jgi:hypothetical protein
MTGNGGRKIPGERAINSVMTRSWISLQQQENLAQSARLGVTGRSGMLYSAMVIVVLVVKLDLL